MALYNKKHGYGGTPIYYVWNQIKQRCYNKKHCGYQWYGRKGISVCDRWRNSFANFLCDMGDRPSNKHSIERLDSSKNYEPTNCVWATRTQQARNQSNNVKYLHNGVEKLLSELCEEYKINYFTIRTRLKLGWSLNESLTTPVRIRSSLKTSNL